MADVEEVVDAVEEEVEEVEEEEEELVVSGASEIKLFGKWSFDDIEIRDISLEVCPVSGVLNRFQDPLYFRNCSSSYLFVSFSL
jgi:predicted glycosyl hydrolase (DUF1957 family)